MHRPALGGIAVLLLCVPVLAGAQRAARRPAAARPVSEAVAVRAEYAAVLLQAEKYREAAKEYRALLAIDSTNTRYRLGLARALAWDNRFREADRELTVLAARRPVDPAVAPLILSVRAGYEPTAREAAGWVAERPDFRIYRVALAEALVRGRDPRAAIAQYDTLLAVRDSAPLLVGLAAAYTAAGDESAGIERVRQAVERQPADSAVRHAYATVLTTARRYDAAVAQYDTLLVQRPVAPFYLERARVNVARDRPPDAEEDVRAALAARPSVDAYLMLGDLYRQRGSFAAAGAAYENARLIGGGDSRIAASVALLAREARPVIAFVPAYDLGSAWQVAALAESDNIGMSYLTLGARRGVMIPFGASGSIGAEYRRLGADDQFGSRQMSGVAVDAGASRTFLHGQLGGRFGGVAHSPGGITPYASIAATGWIGAAVGSIEAAGGPSYPELMTLTSLRGPGGERAITERSLRLSLGGPVRQVDVALSGERALMSDGNTRLTAQGVARYQLAPGLAALYSLSMLRFAERSERYWDPRGYVANALGLELATRKPRGFSVVARVLPGVAQSDEIGSLALVTAGSRTRSTTAQLNASGELGYRARAWEFAVAASYGRGRSGGYQRGGANAILRLTP